MKPTAALPRWVRIVYAIMEFIDYQIISPLSTKLMIQRYKLQDKYCQCDKCLSRDKTQPGWRPK